jgi:mycoredoxin
MSSTETDATETGTMQTSAIETDPTSGTPFVMYSTPWCGYCQRLKGQLDREGIEFDIVDIEQHPEAATIVEEVNGGNQTVPTVVYSDGTAQTNPSLVQIKAKLASLG